MNNNVTLLVFLFIATLFGSGCAGTGTHQNVKTTTLDYDSMMRMDFAKIEALAQKGNPVAQYVMAEFYMDGMADLMNF